MSNITEMALIFIGVAVLGLVVCWVVDRVFKAVRRRRRRREAVVRIRLENEMLRAENRHLKLINDVVTQYEFFIK